MPLTRRNARPLERGDTYEQRDPHLALTIPSLRKSLTGPIARSAVVGVGVRLAGMALLFAQAILAARLLGTEDYGVVSILLAVAHIASAFVLFGFAHLATAEIPRQRQLGHKGVERLFLRHSARRLLGLCLVALPLSGVGIAWLLGINQPLVILLALACVPLIAGLQLLRGVALGLERPLAAQAPSELVRPALFLACMLLVWTLSSVDTFVFMALYAAIACLTLVLALPSVRAKSPQPTETEANAADPKVLQREWDSAALPFLGMHLATLLQAELATLMLGLFASPEAAGLFQPVARISLVLMLPALALSLRFNPKIAALHTAGQREDIARLSRKYTWASTAAVAGFGAVLCAFASFVLGLFGDAFRVGVPLVWIVVAGRIAMTIFGPGAPILAMTGHSGKALKALAISLVLEALLAMTLIPYLGLEGAAISVAAGLAIRGLLLARTSQSAVNLGLAHFWGVPRTQPSKA